jgi:hypothetical protein
VFDTVREAIVAAPGLRDKVRLVTLSFRPRARLAVGDARVCGQPGER